MLLCPCGSNSPYEKCCLSIINGTKNAETPEQLMRSRYSAYANNDIEYIYKTYANETRQFQSIKELTASAKSCQWIKLSINDCSIISDIPTVEFSATYIENNIVYTMTEKSRFIKETSQRNHSKLKQNNWFYLDGDIIEHKEEMTISRNDICPCHINTLVKKKKKYKRCCGK